MATATPSAPISPTPTPAPTPPTPIPPGEPIGFSPLPTPIPTPPPKVIIPTPTPAPTPPPPKAVTPTPTPVPVVPVAKPTPTGAIANAIAQLRLQYPQMSQSQLESLVAQIGVGTVTGEVGAVTTAPVAVTPIIKATPAQLADIASLAFKQYGVNQAAVEKVLIESGAAPSTALALASQAITQGMSYGLAVSGKPLAEVFPSKPAIVPQVTTTVGDKLQTINPIPPPANAVVTERDAKGNPTVYRAGNVDYYTEYSTMFNEYHLQTSKQAEQAGFKTSGIIYPLGVSLKTAEGKTIAVTRETAQYLSTLKGQALFDAQIKLGLIPEGSRLVRVDPDGSVAYQTPQQIKAESEAQAFKDGTIVGVSSATNEILLKSKVGEEKWFPISPDIAKKESIVFALRELGAIDDKGNLNINRAYDSGISKSDLLNLDIDSKLLDIVEQSRIQQAQYANWTGYELMYGKVDDKGLYIPSPYGVKGTTYYAYPDWVQTKIQTDANAALQSLSVYKDAVGRYELVKAISEKVPDQTLRIAGFTDKNITDAHKALQQITSQQDIQAQYKAIEDKLAPYGTYVSGDVLAQQLQRASNTTSPFIADRLAGQQIMNYDIGGALNDGKVTRNELKQLGYTDAQMDKAQAFSEVGNKALIPVYGSVLVYQKEFPYMSGFERGLQIAGDAIMFIPFVGGMGKAGALAMKAGTEALEVGIAEPISIAQRLGTAGKNLLFMGETTAKGMVETPFQLIKEPTRTLKGLWETTVYPFAHPLATAKGLGAVATGRVFLGEPVTTRAISFLTSRSTIPEGAIAMPTEGTGVQRLFISSGLTPTEALNATQMMQLKLSDMVMRGETIPKIIEVPIYENGQLRATIKFPTTEAMRELGVAVHATPFAERILVGAAEPIGENKMYFSTAMSPEWTGATARGLTTPEVVQIGRGNAVIKDMRINRVFDPVDKVYKGTVEMEMTIPSGKQIVTSSDSAFTVLKEGGNVKVYPAIAMEQTPSENIVRAIRNSEGKQFIYKPIDFTEIKSIPREVAGDIEGYIKENNMMVGGSAAERTWTNTIKVAEDLDLISLNNTAGRDAYNLSKLSQSKGIETRVKTPAEVGKEVYRIEKFNPNATEMKEVVTIDPKTGAKATSMQEVKGVWEQVTDINDYKAFRQYNPDIKEYPIVDNHGIKMENPLEQAERINAKVDEYKAGDIPLEQHRGHSKRLGWIATALLDSPGGKLTAEDIKTLSTVGARVNFGDMENISTAKLIRLKLGGLRDELFDKIVPRRIKVVMADGRETITYKDVADEYDSFLRNNLRATEAQKQEVLKSLEDRVVAERESSIYEAFKEARDFKSWAELTALEKSLLSDSGVSEEVYSQTRRVWLDSLDRLESEIRVKPEEQVETRPEIEFERGIPERFDISYRQAIERAREPIAEREQLREIQIPSERVPIAIERVTTERLPTERVLPERVLTERMLRGKVPIERVEIGQIPTERILTERERLRMQTERVIPEREVFKRIFVTEGISPSEKRREEFIGSLYFQQGFGFWAIKAPYKNQQDIAFFKEPPRGGQRLVGVGAAYKTIQQLTGAPPTKALKIPLGIVTVKIDKPEYKPGRKGAISYKMNRAAKKGKATGVVKIIS